MERLPAVPAWAPASCDLVSHLFASADGILAVTANRGSTMSKRQANKIVDDLLSDGYRESGEIPYFPTSSPGLFGFKPWLPENSDMDPKMFKLVSTWALPIR